MSGVWRLIPRKQLTRVVSELLTRLPITLVLYVIVSSWCHSHLWGPPAGSTIDPYPGHMINCILHMTSVGLRLRSDIGVTACIIAYHED